MKSSAYTDLYERQIKERLSGWAASAAGPYENAAIESLLSFIESNREGVAALLTRLREESPEPK